jgi:hypothetical protein
VSDMPLPKFDAAPRPAVGRRVAWAMVLIMTVLFLLALVAVIWGFTRQARILLAKRAAPVAAAQAAPAAAELTLAPGARILSVRTEAGKLVLEVATPGGTEVEIIDLGSGKLTGQVRPAPARTAP